MITKRDTNKQRLKRHKRIRSRISGTASKPRLCVFRSNSNIYAQIIDDVTGNTIISASSLEKDFAEFGGNREAARLVGTAVAKKALAAGITEVVFDRGGYLYHGRVKELADGAREAGLII